LCRLAGGGLLAAALLLAASPAHGLNFRFKKSRYPLRLDITESLLGSYHGDLGGLITETDRMGRPVVGARWVDIINRLNVVLAWWRLRFATRFDTAGFPYVDAPAGQTPCGDPAMTQAALRSRFCQRPFYLEKASVEYTSKALDLTLGDYYVVFGRGLVLSLRKVDELGIDTTLLGGKLVFHDENVAATLVAGATNIQNVDQSTGRIADDPYDLIAGGRVEYRIANRVTLGVHGTGGIYRRNLTNAPQLRPDNMLMYGATLDAPRLLRWLNLYFEAAGQMLTLSGNAEHGYALYGSATAYTGPVSFLLEVKHYSSFKRWKSSVDPGLPEFAPLVYNQPPTAERILTELTSPVYDVTGPRLRIDWRVNHWLLVFASHAFFEDRGSLTGREYYHDPHGGLELRWQNGASHFFPSGGYRIEQCAPDNMECQANGFDGNYQQIGHVEWDFTQKLPRGMSIESQGWALFRRGDLVIDVQPDGSQQFPWFYEGNGYLSFKWTPHLIFVLGYEWSTRPSPRANQHFFNGSVQWNITTATSIRLWAGGTRGGLRCISGICRDFPAVTGAVLDLVVRL
jgi:hypothetical protein